MLLHSSATLREDSLHEIRRKPLESTKSPENPRVEGLGFKGLGFRCLGFRVQGWTVPEILPIGELTSGV